MNKKMILLALIGGFAFMGTAGAAVPPTPPDMGPAFTCNIYEATGWHTFEASWLVGHLVYTPLGNAVGQISGMVVDKANDRVALAILSDVPGVGAKRVAVPYGSLVRTGEDTFQISFGDRQLGVAGPVAEVPSDPFLYEMTKAPGNSDLYGIPSTIESAWVSEIYNYYGQVPYWNGENEKPLEATDMYVSTRMMGAEVRSPQGESVARINDFLIDSSTGRIAFLVLSDVQGRTDKMVAVPFNTLSGMTENAFVLTTTREQIASAPSFDEAADLDNQQWAASVYSFFGLQPCWEG